MVHFGEKLRTNTVGEWAEHYVNYKLLKKTLKKYIAHTKNSVTTLEDASQSSLTSRLLTRFGSGAEMDNDPTSPPRSFSGIPLSQLFMEQLNIEFAKVNGFYNHQQAILCERVAFYEDSLRNTVTARRSSINAPSPPGSPRNRDVYTRESIMRALRECYRSMVQLQNFTQLNYTAFVKICKKFRKTLRRASTVPVGQSMAEEGVLDTEVDQFMQGVKDSDFFRAVELNVIPLPFKP